MKLKTRQTISWTNSAVGGEPVTKTVAPGVILSVGTERPEFYMCHLKNGEEMVVFKRDIKAGKLAVVQ